MPRKCTRSVRARHAARAAPGESGTRRHERARRTGEQTAEAANTFSRTPRGCLSTFQAAHREHLAAAVKRIARTRSRQAPAQRLGAPQPRHPLAGGASSARHRPRGRLPRRRSGSPSALRSPRERAGAGSSTLTGSGPTSSNPRRRTKPGVELALATPTTALTPSFGARRDRLGGQADERAAPACALVHGGVERERGPSWHAVEPCAMGRARSGPRARRSSSRFVSTTGPKGDCS